MAARPQTLYGIADSPVGLAAWLIDHNDADAQPAAAVTDALDRTTSATGELTRDEILDNITLYWLTNTGVSASRLYWEYKGGFFNAKGVSIPVAVTVFPGEQYEAPSSWTEQAYPGLLHYNAVERGGHFGAWERPTCSPRRSGPRLGRFARGPRSNGLRKGGGRELIPHQRAAPEGPGSVSGAPNLRRSPLSEPGASVKPRGRVVVKRDRSDRSTDARAYLGPRPQGRRRDG